MAHTPGPYILERDVIYGPPDFRSRHKNGRPALAQLVPLAGKLAPGFDGGEYSKEDGLLFAAAPELLTALERIVDWSDAGCNPGDADIEAARAAIAKARGAK